MPSPIQHLLCSAEGYRLRRTRFGQRFEADLRDVMARTWVSADEIQNYRDGRLEAFVRQAMASPFYRRQQPFGEIATGGPHSFADFPILTKSTVQLRVSDIARPGIRPFEIAHTSGSTGAGLRFPVTSEAIRQQLATWWRYRQWHGIERDVWCGYFGGRSVVPWQQRRPPFWRYNVPGRQLFFSAYHLRPDTWRAYLGGLRRHQPPWIHGYPSILALLATYLLEHRVSLGYHVRWITVGAENVLPLQATAIEQAFGVRPRQHYGMAEAAANASECPAGRLHVDEDFAYVEFVPRDTGPGYRIVGTNFTNPAFPLIRYDVGDIAHISGKTCDCGRPGRIIDRIDGRREDYVQLPDGSLIGRLDHIFKDQVRVREAQIHQPELRRVVLRIVRGEGFTADDEAAVVREARARLGGNLQIDVDYVEVLPRTASGKLRFVVSDVIPAAVSGLMQGAPAEGPHQ